MAQNISGQGVDYETFKAEYDNDPALQDVIDNFDERGVTLKTSESDMPVQQGQASVGSVESSAKRAAAKVVNR